MFPKCLKPMIFRGYALQCRHHFMKQKNWGSGWKGKLTTKACAELVPCQKNELAILWCVSELFVSNIDKQQSLSATAASQYYHHHYHQGFLAFRVQWCQWHLKHMRNLEKITPLQACTTTLLIVTVVTKTNSTKFSKLSCGVENTICRNLMVHHWL